MKRLPQFIFASFAILTTIATIGMVGCGSSDEAPKANESFVCGMDGVTYTVEDASKASVDAMHRGRCDSPMVCGDGSECFAGDECRQFDCVVQETEPPVLRCQGPSACIPQPCACTEEYAPVCGHDGRTYSNACAANCAGAPIKRIGECETPPGIGCVRGGCSGQLCLEEGVDYTSTCEWRDVYACYQAADCARQQNGQCGFTPTYELVQCLDRNGEGCYGDQDCGPGYRCEFPYDREPWPVDAGIAKLSIAQPGMCVPRANDCYNNYDCAITERCDRPDYYDGGVGGTGGHPHDAGIPKTTIDAGNPPPIPEDGGFGGSGGYYDAGVINPPIDAGRCVEACALVDCAPGYACEHGACIPTRLGCQSDEECGITERCDTSIAASPLEVGICVEACSLIDCVPGYACEHGACVPQDGHCGGNADCRDGEVCFPPSKTCQPQCAINCFVYEPVCGEDGKTYGCGAADAHCNGVEVAYHGECRSGDCRTEGCDGDGYICSHCDDGDGGSEWICLGPNQGACPPPREECRPTGCSGQLCADTDIATTCEWEPEYACYQNVGSCERLPHGECGWVPTDELNECLAEFDCRAEGCGEGEYCDFCWFSFECIPNGAVC